MILKLIGQLVIVYNLSQRLYTIKRRSVIIKLLKIYGGAYMSQFIDGFIEKAKESNNKIDNELYSKF